MPESTLAAGRAVLANEQAALAHLADILDDDFPRAVELLYTCRGKVVVSGMGKSGHIANKIAATMASTGTPAVFLSPAEGGHGDLGIVQEHDVLILISKSGETDEISLLLPFIKRIGARIVSITNTRACTLARAADVALELGVGEEACPLNLAPTTSTTATLALGDALSVALMQRRGFQPEDFALYHPAGSLGRQLLKVKDLMETEDLPLVPDTAIVRDALQSILTHRNRGVAIVVDGRGALAGIVVDGDLKRLLLRHADLLDLPVREVMTKTPRTIDPEALVGEALKKMEGKITSLLIVDGARRPVGLLHIHDILEARVL